MTTKPEQYMFFFILDSYQLFHYSREEIVTSSNRYYQE